jgi:hypothetical protein
MAHALRHPAYPSGEAQRYADAEQIGADGLQLLGALYHETAPRWLREILTQVYRAGENSPPTPRHRCGDEYRPTRRVARWPTTRQNPDLPFCRIGGLKGDFDEFGNGIACYGNPWYPQERGEAEFPEKEFSWKSLS